MIAERPKNPASLECVGISRDRTGLPFVSGSALLLRPAVRDGERGNSRSRSQAVHQVATERIRRLRAVRALEREF